MNGHFAAVGDEPTAQHYEHGIQVIDEDKAFKLVPSIPHSPSMPRCPQAKARQQDSQLTPPRAPQHESQ
jgi:hypothetical protein